MSQEREWAMQQMVAENQQLGLYDEPVAWIRKEELAYMSAVAGQSIFEWKVNLGLKPQAGDVPLYTAPREWVSLTDEEVNVIIDKEIGFNSCWGPEEKFARAIEAKLREKNGG